MFKFQFVVLCSLTVAFASKVPYIDKCVWSDKQCLIQSSQKMVTKMAGGIPEFNIASMEPMELGAVKVHEQGLEIAFSEMKWTGASKCVIKDVERDINKGSLKVVIACPIQIKGHYVASGKISGIPVTGDGPFSCQSDEMEFTIDIGQKFIEKDGQKYWKFVGNKHTFEVKKNADLDFSNLFNGDEEKAAPVNTILKNNGKELMHTIGGPIVQIAVDIICDNVAKMVENVPASDLEI